MKRIIDGKTYNTDTSTLLARGWGNDTQEDLYVTRGGAFFVRITERGEADRLNPMDREEVDTWLGQGEVELLDNTIFAEPEEAAAAREPEATIYVRVPRSLKDRIEAGAKDDELSVNAWVMRCIEQCAGRDREDGAGELWRAHYIASAIDAVPDGYTMQQCLDAFREIRSAIASAWGDLGLPRSKGQSLDEDVLLYKDTLGDPGLSREWEPYQHETA